jgi:hypothetical protein
MLILPVPLPVSAGNIKPVFFNEKNDEMAGRKEKIFFSLLPTLDKARFIGYICFFVRAGLPARFF